MYEIESRSDFQAGTTLTVRIPQNELDKKALYTLLADPPDFILPFRHRAIDGQVEFTFQVGGRSKLAYLSGSRSPAEYAGLWLGLLQPLLDCGDWFMSPYSFVLQAEHLYCDKKTGAMSFVYIPALRPCSDYSALKTMVTEVARHNHVTDVNLENKTVWAIQDFNLQEFLQMMKPYQLQTAAPAAEAQQPQPVAAPSPTPAPPPAQPVPAPKVPQAQRKAPVDTAPPVSVPSRASDEISISFPGDSPGDKKAKGGLFGAKKEKPPKQAPEPKEKSGLFGKKKSQDILQGAATEPLVPVFSGPSHAPIPMPIYEDNLPEDDVTLLDMDDPAGPRLRYIGTGGHPPLIEVGIERGAIFTIGRFDTSVGVKQSSFEFDKRTKAVSRRHAAIERDAEGYRIVDLDSGAGTYLNGQKLPPNAPFKLSPGCRVSLGHSGADYMWEE